MKKRILMWSSIIILVLCVAFMITAFAVEENNAASGDANYADGENTEAKEYIILGDVNGDGAVTNADVLMIYRNIYDSELYPLPIIEKYGENGLTPFINEDGNWQIGDADTGVKAIGEEGIGIAEAYVEDGMLYIRKTNEEVAVSVGSVKGEKGDKGDQGEQGPKGDKGDTGATGRGILRTEIVGTNWVVYYTDGTTETHDLSEMIGDPNEREILVFSELSDGTYGVMAGGMAKYEAVIEIPATYNGKNVTQILTSGFAELAALRTVIIPDTITTIGNRAFYNCIGLDTIILPSKLIAIEEYAFYNCDMLTEITIPASTSFIGKWAFVNSGITSITFENTTTGTSGWHFENKIKPYSVYSNYSSTYSNFEIDLGTKSYKMPSPVSSCTISLKLVDASTNALYLTNNYKYVNLPTSLSNDYLMLKIYDVNWVNPEATPALPIVEELEYTLLSDGTYAVSLGTVTDKNIIIPSSYNGISVTQIKENGFKGITALESVVLPEGIVKIGKNAFSDCTNLELTIPESVKTIDPYALYNVKTITVRGTNSWSVTGVSWTEYFGDSLIDYGNNQNFSGQEISASSYSSSVAIAPTRGGSSAYKSPWTGTWTR